MIVIGDLNIHISHKRKDNNSFLSDLCDTFSQQNIITEKIAIKLTQVHQLT